MQSAMLFSVVSRGASVTGTSAKADPIPARKAAVNAKSLGSMRNLSLRRSPIAEDRNPHARIVPDVRAQLFALLDRVDVPGEHLHEIEHVGEIEPGDDGVLIVLDQELTRVGMRVDHPFEFALGKLEARHIALKIRFGIGEEDVGRRLLEQRVAHWGGNDVLRRLSAEADDAVELTNGFQLVVEKP